MADEQDSVVKVFSVDEDRPSVLGQSTEKVVKMQKFLLAEANALGGQMGYPEAASALLGASVNFLLSIYTVESVKEVLEGVLPNLQAMHDTIEASWLMSAADVNNPQ